MNRKDIINHKALLVDFMNMNRSINTLSIVSVVLLYSIALYLLIEHHLVMAIILSTIGFILAKLYLRYSIYLSRYLLSYREGAEEVLLFIDKELEGKESKQFLEMLGGALNMVKE
ncbi:MAG: hypothetical protein KAH22_06565 [Thiotrichaceae bacterium]|nr:hypothetical protein [Thiotrichaceae bacterium]